MYILFYTVAKVLGSLLHEVLLLLMWRRSQKPLELCLLRCVKKSSTIYPGTTASPPPSTLNDTIVFVQQLPPPPTVTIKNPLARQAEEGRGPASGCIGSLVLA
jgi:hypothetical protein